MLQIHRIIANNFQENTYVLVDEATRETAVIDPGMLFDEEREAFDRLVTGHGLKVNQVILTHAHLDHCFGVSYVKDRYGAVVKGHPADAPLLEALPRQARRFGMEGVFDTGSGCDVDLKDGDTVSIGESTLQVLHVPGHSPGGIALYDAVQGFVITGDSLFEGSIGRTDLEGGDQWQLVDAVRQQLLTLPPKTLVLPGHGNPSTIEKEKATNPFLR